MEEQDTNGLPERTPEDLVSVREAARAIGLTDGAVHSWIKRGRLTAYVRPGRRGRQVSVRALCAPLDPQAPPEALLVYAVARALGVSRDRITGWARRGVLPSWQGRHGLLVRIVDARAVAQRQGLLPGGDEGERSAMRSGTGEDGQTPQQTPNDLAPVREAAQAVGVTPSAVHRWVKRGRLTVQIGPAGYRMSRAAVRALCAPPDPQTPPEARPIYELARGVGVPRALIAPWMKWRLLPTWEGRHGKMVRPTNVGALAQQRGVLPPGDEPGETA